MFIDEEHFERINSKDLQPATYEGCTFTECDFSNGDFSGIHFVECEFIECNLSNIKVVETKLQEVQFVNCKIMGFPFTRCSPLLFSVQFTRCKIELCPFDHMSIPGIQFSDCQLVEVDFSRAIMNKAYFNGSEFDRCIFDDTQLKNADFRETRGLVLNPEFNQLQGAQFNPSGLAGLLTKYRLKIED